MQTKSNDWLKLKINTSINLLQNNQLNQLLKHYNILKTLTIYTENLLLLVFR